jgi:hypothetical protein
MSACFMIKFCCALLTSPTKVGRRTSALWSLVFYMSHMRKLTTLVQNCSSTVSEAVHEQTPFEASDFSKGLKLVG